MTDEESARYWAAKAKEWRIACAFMSEVKPGDTVKIERYAFPEFSPYAMNDHAHIHDRKVVRVFAMNERAKYFTTYAGEAIEARTLISYEIKPKQLQLFGNPE